MSVPEEGQGALGGDVGVRRFDGGEHATLAESVRMDGVEARGRGVKTVHLTSPELLVATLAVNTY